MKKKCLKRILTIMLLILTIATQTLAETALWDGYLSESVIENDVELINFNNSQAITAAGAKVSMQHTMDGIYSACWLQSSKKELVFKDVPRDWTNYDFIELWIYAENADYTQFLFGPVCYPLEGQSENASYFYTYTEVRDGWNHFIYNLNTFTNSRNATYDRIKNLRFTVNGWGLSANENAKYYISSVKLRRFDMHNSLKENYNLDYLQQANEILENAVAIYGGSPNVVKNAEVTTYDGSSNKLRSVMVNDSVCVPVSFFADYMDCKVSGKENVEIVSDNGKRVTLSINNTSYAADDGEHNLSDAPALIDGVLYVPVCEIATALGKHIVREDKLIIMSDSNDIDVFKSNGSLNDLQEIVQYLAASVQIKGEDVSSEDFQKAKDAWRYSIVADETIDVNDADFKKKLNSISSSGKSAWGSLQKGKDATELFEGIESVTSASLTNQYQRLQNMALAYGTYGNELYHNEELKNDILYALEWLYQNRYGQNEINGTGWRSTSEYNWWDWQIGVPEKLINVMMIMEEFLSEKQIENYLSLFDHLVPKVYSTGANRFDFAKSIIGSGLLRKDAQRVIDARDALDQTFLYVDNGRNNKQGFYTDGSYIYHEAHAMNGTYGMEQLEETGVFLSILKGTAFEYTNPQAENVSDWYYNAYEPLMYQGAVMRMVRGRNNPPAERSKGTEVIAYMIDMIDALGTEDAARFKSIIKHHVSENTTKNYYTSLSLAQATKLKEIMNDSTVLPREEYLLNKVYYNMDKVVHQREDFAAGISMSSSRIFPYECINGQNNTGWYMGDGMMTVYNKDDFTQYSDSYWKNINPYRLPGITADTQERPAVNIATGNEWRGKQDFVGGVTMENEFGVAAMSLESYHSDVEIGTDKGTYGGPSPIHDCNLTAKKSWFMFDDEIVCLGTDIDASNDVNVLTIVDNRLSTKKLQLGEVSYQGEKYAVESVVASQEPESENVAANTIDEQLATKWAAEGEADITWDLGEVKKCGFINLAFANGNKRSQIFDLYSSEDGINWTMRFSGMSSGITESPEAYDLGNCNARYIRLNSHGSTATSQWISLTMAEIYPAYEGEMPKLETKVNIGTDKVTVEGIGEADITTQDKSLYNKKWIALENSGGYYFPSGGNIFARRTSGAESFFELWLDHGVNPDNADYEYVTLPGKNESETQLYSQNPDIEILANTPQLQAVYEKTLGITGIIFWEAGSFNGITVSHPMLLMLKEENGVTSISVSDPTHKLETASITMEGRMKCIEYDSRITPTEKASVELAIDFKNSSGCSIGAKLIK